MILSAIAAMARNRVIGLNNALPWDLPEDMKFFREKTKGHVMIMGRKTFESFPKPLPNRFHIVVTRNPVYDVKDPMVEVVSSLPEAIELAHKLTKKFQQKFGDEVFVIGGAEIYKQSLDVIDKLYLTVIEKDFEGDASFPTFDETQLKLADSRPIQGPIPFSFRTYQRVQPSLG